MTLFGVGEPTHKIKFIVGLIFEINYYYNIIIMYVWNEVILFSFYFACVTGSLAETFFDEVPEHGPLLPRLCRGAAALQRDPGERGDPRRREPPRGAGLRSPGGRGFGVRKFCLRAMELRAFEYLAERLNTEPFNGKQTVWLSQSINPLINESINESISQSIN